MVNASPARRIAPFVLVALIAGALYVGLPAVTSLANQARGQLPRARHIVLQLKWWHQFQFAGYYAALSRGFYREEGLEVELRQGAPSVSVLREVLDRRAHFGISDAGALAAYMRGEPLTAVSVTFQHSPYVLLTLRERGLLRPSDLAGGRVMLAGNEAEVQFRALLTREGVSTAGVTVVPHSMRLESLVDGEIDAMSAYSTVEPAELRARGIDPHVIRASDYGVDFYDDILVAREDLAQGDPQLVEAFRRANGRGWEYAIAHPGEIVDEILRMPGVAERGVTRALLHAEAEETAKLMAADVVPYGHINPGRLERMAQIYAEASGQPYRSVERFAFALPPPWFERWKTSLLVAAGVLLTLVCFALLWIGQLRQAVTTRTAEIEREAAQRRATEQQLRASEEQFRAVVDEMPVLYAAFDREGGVLCWNKACERVTGYRADEVIGNPDVANRLLPDVRMRMRFEAARRIDTSDSPIEWQLTAKDGSRHILRALLMHQRVRLPGWPAWGVAFDVTGERQAEATQRMLEERLQQARQFESLGMLAGGIAHDFNNLLTGILGNADLALADLAEDARASESVRLIEQAARRATELTRQLLAYSGKERIEFHPTDVSPLVADITKLIDVSVTKRCRVQLALRDRLPAVEADATRLRQVVMNLVLNAAEAVGGDGGTVTVKTDLVHADRALLSQGYIADELPEGMYVLIEVSDTGLGMTDAVKKRIFEPFFSTKFQGRGLGLAAALGTVRSHRGTMIVQSTVGEGTTFSVLLPASNRIVMAASIPAAPKSWKGQGLVLVVDDEESVRKVAARMLDRMGFRVAHASDGQAALEMFERAPGDYAAVLLDLTMPRMGGQEALAAIRRICPDVPVVLSSGYHEPDAVKSMEAAHGVQFIQKPYKYDELATRMRDALEPPEESVA